MKRIILLVGLGVFATSWVGDAHAQDCQDQACVKAGNCYQCISADGEACSAQRNAKCPKTCEGTICDDSAAARGSLSGINSQTQSLLQPHGLSEACQASLAKAPVTAMKPFTGTAASAVFQKGSPLIITQWMTAIDNNSALSLKRIVIQNLGTTSVSAYRLGWMEIYADSSHKPDVHFGELQSLGALSPKEVLAVGEPVPLFQSDDEAVRQREDDAFVNSGRSVIPSITNNPDLRAVIFFVATVKRQGAPDFNEDVEALQSQQVQRFKF